MRVARPQARELGRQECRRSNGFRRLFAGGGSGAATLLGLAWLATGAAYGEVGNGFSGLFAVDTRYGFSLGSRTSGFFTVDTRHSGYSGEGVSGLFTVDTTGAVVGTGVIAGQVADTNGVGLSGATVSASINSVLRAQAATDDAGSYTLSALPAGAYDLWVQQAGYRSGVSYGVPVANGQTAWQPFVLPAMPPPPVVVPTNRAPEPPATLATSQLKRFDGTTWVTVTNASDIDRGKTTVVLTHGWNSSSEAWPSNMARMMVSGGITNANLLAWDWRTNAGTGPRLLLASSRTPGEGRLLAQTLTNLLGFSYQQGIHFVGHSLGTLVNATAADRLHAHTGGAFDWQRTQMTLLDNAELVNAAGQLLLFGPEVAGFESLLAMADVKPLGWVSPLPEQRAWADNYISLVGMYHLSVVNAWLPKGLAYSAQTNPLDWLSDAHGYACGWYADTTGDPNLSPQLGNRYSFERLGIGAQFPASSPYVPGALFVQVAANDYTLVPVQDVPGYMAQQALEFAKSELLEGLSWAEGVGQKVGNAWVDVCESAVSVVQQAEEATWRVVSHPISSFRAVLQSSGGLLPKGPRWPQGENDYTNSPSAVWLPVQVPTNAALFSFDFTFTGDAGQDILSASLNGTNVFALEAQDMPAGQVLDSGPIDVSPFAGQTVELFFGLLGGTSTKATLSVEAMRFYQIAPPMLAAEKADRNIILSWSAMVTGYALESTTSLTSPDWAPVTNAPALSGLRQYVTNSVVGQGQFYRLRRN
jgi:pimeloyl-ACP methyl ester carboxylesterase